MKFPFAMIIPAILISIFLIIAISSVIIKVDENKKLERRFEEQELRSPNDYQGFDVIEKLPFSYFRLSYLFRKEFLIAFLLVPVLLLIRVIYLRISGEEFGESFDKKLLSAGLTSLGLGIIGVLAQIFCF